MADLEVYGFQLTTNFWDSYEPENEHSDLNTLAQLGAFNFNIPVNLMKKLAITCKCTFNLVQWRLLKCKKLRHQILPKFRRAVHKKLIRHPFQYTGRVVKTVSIPEMGFSNFGIRILDIEGDNLFDEDFTRQNRVALADVSFILQNPISFVGVCFLGPNAVVSFEIDKSDLIDLDKIIPNRQKKIESNYGDHPDEFRPGRYLARLNLPFELNPIMLDDPFISKNRVHFCIAPTWSISRQNGEEIADIIFSADFVAQHFSHAIIKFQTTARTSYDWSKYGLTFNGVINQHAITTSFIRALDDPEIVNPPAHESQNAEILGDGHINAVPDGIANIEFNSVRELALAALFNALGMEYARLDNPPPTDGWTESDDDSELVPE